MKKRIFLFTFRRQHMGSWSNGASKENMVPPTTPTAGQSPDRLRGATQDLFELLERVQCSRLDDQRCVLPPYFSQVSFLFEIIYFYICFVCKYTRK